MRSIFESVKTWGRRGTDDEFDSLNLLTFERRAVAVAEACAPNDKYPSLFPSPHCASKQAPARR